MSLIPDNYTLKLSNGPYQIINYFVTGFLGLVAAGFICVIIAIDRGIYWECVQTGGFKHVPATATTPTKHTGTEDHCYSLAQLASGGEQYLHKDVAGDADTIWWLTLTAGAVGLMAFTLRWWLVRQSVTGGAPAGIGRISGDFLVDIIDTILATTTVALTSASLHMYSTLLKDSHAAYKFWPISDILGSINEADYDLLVSKDLGFTLLMVALSLFSINALWKLTNIIGFVKRR